MLVELIVAAQVATAAATTMVHLENKEQARHINAITVQVNSNTEAIHSMDGKLDKIITILGTK